MAVTRFAPSRCVGYAVRVGLGDPELERNDDTGATESLLVQGPLLPRDVHLRPHFFHKLSVTPLAPVLYSPDGSDGCSLAVQTALGRSALK